ncbi:MAG: hypothetical protein ACREIC_14530, partial [Limisphaerales bacterium]
MVNDPERPIEKLLRECAEARRHEGKPPAQLHPVNRRLLQDEVKRVFGRTGAARPRLWFLPPRGLRGWGFALGGLGTVLAVVILVWPGMKPTDRTQLLARRDEPAPPASLMKTKPVEPVPPNVAAPVLTKEEPSKPGFAANENEALLKSGPAVALKDEARADGERLATVASAAQG